MIDCIEQIKECTKCHISKDPNQFRKNDRLKSGLNSWCKNCENLATRSRYIPRGDNKRGKGIKPPISKTRDYIRNQSYKSAYSITLEDYTNMYNEQEGKCKICSEERNAGGNKGLVIDHCHKTGKVRGLLCPSCNSAIGKLKEDPEIFKLAMNYLNNFK